VVNEWGREVTLNMASPSPVSAYNMEFLHFPPLPYAEIDSQLLQSNFHGSSNSDVGHFYSEGLQCFEPRFCV
jgi:hypothetical protein